MCAVFNEILSGRFNRAVQKIFSMKGPPPTPQIASEIIPVHAFGTGVELRFVESWDRFVNTVVQPAVAANNSQVRFRNQAGSNTIVVFEKLLVLAGATADQPAFQLATTNADFSTLTTGNTIRMDARTGNRTGSLIVSRGAGAAISGPIEGQIGMPANQSLDLIFFEDQEYTLLPGDALAVFSNLQNNALTVTAIWRERALEESEQKGAT